MLPDVTLIAISGLVYANRIKMHRRFEGPGIQFYQKTDSDECITFFCHCGKFLLIIYMAHKCLQNSKVR